MGRGLFLCRQSESGYLNVRGRGTSEDPASVERQYACGGSSFAACRKFCALCGAAHALSRPVTLMLRNQALGVHL